MIAITQFSGRDVAVYGLGRTGIAVVRALLAGGARVHAWDDSDVSRAAAVAAGIQLSDINARDWRSFAALVLSPGVPLTHPAPHRVVTLALAVGVPIIGDIELFAREVNALPVSQRPKVAGITGTNGKSTTTALLAHILTAAGRDVRVGGNIGTAVLDLPALHAGAYYVLELSSFQLDLTHSLRCDTAVWLNTTPDHLDRHGDMNNYVAAKRKIFANQGADDCAVVGVDDGYGVATCTELTGRRVQHVVPISAGQALGKGVCALGTKLYEATGQRAEPVADLETAPALAGRHNAQNAAAAFAAARALGVDARTIGEAMKSFPGLAHRLERVATIAGIRFINDSKATNADAAAQALAVYPRVYWIAGGRPKAGGITSLESFFPRIAHAFLIGEAADEFAQTLKGKAPFTICRGGLGDAVLKAFDTANGENEVLPVVLLSPACASYDQFKDFETRGDAFKDFVMRLVNLHERGVS